MDEKKVQDEATLEKVTGGERVTTYLYRCPKCGYEYRTIAKGIARPVCMTCFVTMDRVEDTQQETELK